MFEKDPSTTTSVKNEIVKPKLSTINDSKGTLQKPLWTVNSNINCLSLSTIFIISCLNGQPEVMCMERIMLSLVLKTGVSSQQRIHPRLKRHLMDTIVDNEFQYQTSFNIYCTYEETLEQSSWSYMDGKHHNTTLMLKTGVSNQNCPYPYYWKGTFQKPLWMENSNINCLRISMGCNESE